MIVVMIMRMPPDAARAERQNAEDAHQSFREAGVGEDRVVLLIVINDEEPDEQQTAEDTAHELGGEVEIPKGAGQR